MSLKFGEIELNEKEFHRSKQRIYLNQVEIKKLKSSLVLNLIVNMFMMKNTLKQEKKLLKTTPLQNLPTMKSLNKILIILALLQFVLIKLEKESYPRVNLEQCKLRLKKRKTLTYLMINQKIETE